MTLDCTRRAIQRQMDILNMGYYVADGDQRIALPPLSHGISIQVLVPLKTPPWLMVIDRHQGVSVVKGVRVLFDSALDTDLAILSVAYYTVTSTITICRFNEYTQCTSLLPLATTSAYTRLAHLWRFTGHRGCAIFAVEGGGPSVYPAGVEQAAADEGEGGRKGRRGEECEDRAERLVSVALSEIEEHFGLFNFPMTPIGSFVSGCQVARKYKVLQQPIDMRTMSSPSACQSKHASLLRFAHSFVYTSQLRPTSTFPLAVQQWTTTQVVLPMQSRPTLPQVPVLLEVGLTEPGRAEEKHRVMRALLSI
ncbi:hypothetical protein IW261DRAFT_1594286, partial [Armillaria novae-zelandiae]